MTKEPKDESHAAQTARDFAKQNIEQVKDAQEQFLNAISEAQAMFINSTGMKNEGAADLNKKTIEYSKANIQSGFDLAKKLVDATDISQAMQIQNEYLRKQMEAYGAQAKDILNLVNRTDGKK